MARIFLSYRRQDAPYVALALKDRVEAHFGAESVFIDVDNVPIGVDFRRHIETAVGQCDAMLVLIGAQWLAVAGKDVKNRLFEPRDYVRIEIEAALGRGIPVVPVLVDEAAMPPAGEMPESIQDLAYRNAAEIRAGRDFRTDVDRLVDGLARLLSPPAPVAVSRSEPNPALAPARESAPPDPRKADPPANHTRAHEVPAETKRKTPTSKPAPAKSPKRVIQLSSLNAFTGIRNVYLSPNIPLRKLQNALHSYADNVQKEAVLLLFDDTTFGGAKEGVILTATAAYWNNVSFGLGQIDFADLRRVTLEKVTLSHDITMTTVNKVHVMRLMVNDKFAKELAELLYRIANT